MGRTPTTIPCDERCALLERNRRVAEALDIRPSGDGSDSSTSGGIGGASGDPNSVTGANPDQPEYSEFLVKHAHANLAWVRNVEQRLADFVNDTQGTNKRLYHFPRTKPRNNSFIAQLASTHYGLTADIVDVELGAGSVIVRKTITKAPCVPKVLCSEVAVNYKPSMFAGTAGGSSSGVGSGLGAASVPQSGANGKPPLNALHITSLQFGMEARDLQILLEPLFGSDVSIAVRWISTDNGECVVVVSPKSSSGTASSATSATASTSAAPGGSSTALDIERMLIQLEPEVRSKLCVTNRFAKTVKCCWYTAEGEIILHQVQPRASTSSSSSGTAGKTSTPPRSNSASNLFQALQPVSITTTNPFDLLEGASPTSATVPSLTTSKSKKKNKSSGETKAKEKEPGEAEGSGMDKDKGKKAKTDKADIFEQSDEDVVEDWTELIDEEDEEERKKEEEGGLKDEGEVKDEVHESVDEMVTVAQEDGMHTKGR
ncbi:hypothetical protein HK102_006973 [Quaeritorhiza haematococci]|nr:hypothetical protein HK102_006973 [Quaeritorhiza haematococci]